MEFMFDFNFRSDLTLIKIQFKIFSFQLGEFKIPFIRCIL